MTGHEPLDCIDVHDGQTHDEWESEQRREDWLKAIADAELAEARPTRPAPRPRPRQHPRAGRGGFMREDDERDR